MEVQNIIWHEEGIQADQYRLVFCGLDLEDERTIAEFFRRTRPFTCSSEGGQAEFGGINTAYATVFAKSRHLNMIYLHYGLLYRA